ncbi:hypothetical protein D9758_008076 [Tetrapyrgos nigripes]|uniref:Uncharacterized protein n=1 Tax=Tetrapyrgos nigripes TaxID=182062 RepID=A0A8H5FWI0_9AGAR|nr:hypothetical protein D9758_008076 [Tetrapyrgos nigripes]
MRLIDTSTLELVNVAVKDGLPAYAVLSHTWGNPEEEVSFQDLLNHPEKAKQKIGYSKIERSCEVARKYGFQYIWIDTCCINKESSAELSEAINSMFLYYRDARVCYAYLADVDSAEDPRAEQSQFQRSRWFSRGWTLQELLAPDTVVFFSNDWNSIGTKASLRDIITRITGIPSPILLPNRFSQQGIKSRMDNCSIAQKMSWAAKRQTTRPEDLAYCLMGIFDVHMPPLYGEGGARAFMRLQEEIVQYSDDQTIFAWRTPRAEVRQRWTSGPKLEYFGDETARGLFASSPAEFIESGNITRFPKSERIERYHRDAFTYHLTNMGLHITLPLLPVDNSSLTYFNRLTMRKTLIGDLFLAVLDCRRQGRDVPLAVYLRRENGSQYVRVLPNRLVLGQRGVWNLTKTIYVKQDGFSRTTQDPPRMHNRHTFKLRLPSSVTIVESHPAQVFDHDFDGVPDWDSQGRLVVGISSRDHGDFGVVKLHDKSKDVTFFVVIGSNSTKPYDHRGIWCDIVTDAQEETLLQIYLSYGNSGRRAISRTYPVDRVVKVLTKEVGILMAVHNTSDANTCIAEIGYVPASEAISRVKNAPSSTYGFAVHVQSWVPDLRPKPLLFPKEGWGELTSSWMRRSVMSFNRTRESGLIVFSANGKDDSLLFAVALGVHRHRPWAHIITSFGNETANTISKSFSGILLQAAKSRRTDSEVSAALSHAGLLVKVNIEENHELEEQITHWVDIRIDKLHHAGWSPKYINNSSNVSPTSIKQMHTTATYWCGTEMITSSLVSKPSGNDPRLPSPFTLPRQQRTSYTRRVNSRTATPPASARMGRFAVSLLRLGRPIAYYATIIEHIDELSIRIFDFVVIGGGTAGNVVANRLTENPDVNVLLLEAGGYDEDDLLTRVPAFNLRTMGSRLDWNFTANLGPGNRTGPVSRGFVLGGSSAINGMVYTRGTSEDWDRYANLTGDPGWSWDSIQQYIRKNERFTLPTGHHNISGQFDPAVHGFDGINSVTLYSYLRQFDDLAIQSSMLPGAEFPFKLDPNAGTQFGMSWSQSTILNGERSSSATSYLAPHFRARRNLHILLHAHVTRILQQDGDQATSFSGVEFTQDAGGSPNILLNSGIGDASTLSDLGITSVLHLPSVGQNYTEQGLIILPWFVNSTNPNEFTSQNATIRQELMKQWLKHKTGPMADGSQITVCYFRLPDNASIFETVEDPAAGPNTAHVELGFVATNIGSLTVPDPSNIILASSSLLTPVSRGFLTINSSNLLDRPVINLNLLSSEFDLVALREGIKAIQRLLKAAPFEGFILQPTTNATTDEEIEEFIRDNVVAGLHPVGSASMSPKGADWGVVDPDLKLKDAKGVRIVDASVLPLSPAAHTQAPVYIVAERASDLIKADWKL